MHPLKGRKQSPGHIQKREQALRRYRDDPEWRKRLGKIIKKSFTPERREQIRQTHLGRKASPETRERIRQALLRQIQAGPEVVERLRRANRGNNHRLGKHHSVETREKLRAANIGKKHSFETRQKMSQAQLGKILTPEHCEKLRQARLIRHFPQKMTSLEETLRNQFKKRRLKFEMHKTMFGRFQPDFMFGDARLIVQADGDYWHRQLKPERDARFNRAAAKENWTVWRFAESEIVQHPEVCGRAVARFVQLCLAGKRY